MENFLSELIGIDTYIALGLIVVAVIFTAIARAGFLPKKSLPYVLAGLLAALGITVFNKFRQSSLQKKLAEEEAAFQAKEKELEKLKDKLGVSQQELDHVRGEMERLRRSYRKQIMLLEAKNKKERERLENLPDDDLQREFDRLFTN